MDNGYFHYPDGTDSDTPPVDGQICRVESHKRGKYVDYTWDEAENEWFLLPHKNTPDEVIDAAKKIMKIGKYYGERPAKTYSGGGYNWEDIFPFAERPIAHSGWDPMTGRWMEDDERDPVTLYQRSALTSAITENHHCPDEAPAINMAYENGSHYVPCECGALYAIPVQEHYQWCPRHPNNYNKFR